MIDSHCSLYPYKPSIPPATSRKELHFLNSKNHTKQMIFTFKMFDIPIRIKLLNSFLNHRKKSTENRFSRKYLFLPIVIWILQLKITIFLEAINLASFIGQQWFFFVVNNNLSLLWKMKTVSCQTSNSKK
jgi:hypothetical protein